MSKYPTESENSFLPGVHPISDGVQVLMDDAAILHIGIRGFLEKLAKSINSKPAVFSCLLNRDAYSTKGFPLNEKMVLAPIPESSQSSTMLILSPAVCQSLFQAISNSVLDRLPRSVFGYSKCFRNDLANSAIGRHNEYSVFEFVSIGDEGQILTQIFSYHKLAQRLLEALQIEFDIVAASDTFWPHPNIEQRNFQLEMKTKHEMIFKLANEEMAIGSINNHGYYFSKYYRINGVNSDFLMSCCMGIGIERLSLALCKQHGNVLEKWPQSVLDSLELQTYL